MSHVEPEDETLLRTTWNSGGVSEDNANISLVPLRPGHREERRRRGEEHPEAEVEDLGGVNELEQDEAEDDGVVLNQDEVEVEERGVL